MSGNTLPKILLKKIQTNRQKEPVETIKKAFKRVRTERFDKWPKSTIAIVIVIVVIIIVVVVGTSRIPHSIAI